MKIMCPRKEQSIKPHHLYSTLQGADIPENGFVCDLSSPGAMRLPLYLHVHISVHMPGALTEGEKEDKSFYSRSSPF